MLTADEIVAIQLTLLVATTAVVANGNPTGASVIVRHSSLVGS